MAGEGGGPGQPPETKRTYEGLKTAHETTKQVLTLNGAILTATIAFAEKFALTKDGPVHWSLKASWGLFVLSSAFAIWALLAITGRVELREHGRHDPPSERVPATAMLVLFLLGLIAVAVAGVQAVR
jgi:hypothetical protein